jgi:hypothetical protein
VKDEGKDIVKCIWIGKQKVILFPKFRENRKEAATSALKKNKKLKNYETVNDS